MEGPPRAPRRPTTLRAHGDVRVDEWYWLRDRDDPDVIGYLEAENRWAESTTAHTRPLQEALFSEIKERIQETDVSAPVAWGPWWYYSRTREGLQYGSHCRRERRGPDEPAAGALDSAAPEQVVIDENVLAKGHDYFALGALAVSPDHRLLAYSTDVDGDEVYTVRVRDLATGADLPDVVTGTYYGLEWAADTRTFFYTVLDEAKRPWRVYRHRLGTDAADDVLVLQEDDEAFHVGLGQTRSRAWLVIALDSMVTSEVHVVPTNEPEAAPRVVASRRQDVEYGVEHHAGRFLIVTNDGAENFRLVEAPVDDPGPERWRDVVPHREDVRLLGVDAFADHLVLHERAEGLTRLRVLPADDTEVHTIAQPEPVHTVGMGLNP